MLAQYDPAQVVVSYGAPAAAAAALGLNLAEGSVAGTFVEVRRVARSWKLLKGGDGESTRLRTNNFAGEVVLTLRQGARTNNVLAGLATADELSGLVVGPLTVRDFGGATLHFAPRAFLDGFPEDGFSVDEEARVWRFLCPELLVFPGGSGQVSGSSSPGFGQVFS